MRKNLIFAGILALGFSLLQAQAQEQLSGKCATAGAYDPAQGALWTGWSPDLTNTRFQPAAAAGLSETDIPKLKLLWAFGFPSATMAFSPTTVVGGRLFVGSQGG